MCLVTLERCRLEMCSRKETGSYVKMDIEGSELVAARNSFQKELIVKCGGISVLWQYMVKKAARTKCSVCTGPWC